MKCHYEVLGVPMNCSSDDLKKAYRKLALEWHPDKNLDRLEEAKETFQLIQQAYEILIDPQERAWYDRHRDDIIFGDSENEYKDDCLDVFQYVNTNCFKGYNDDEKGFYTVYRDVFSKIATEDKPFMEEEEEIEIPQFGNSQSSFEEVVHTFYAHWQSYCTSKSYSWVDKFDLMEARKSGAGRQILRLMEKENKKLRDMKKKQRNEEVRQLVAFVRKRDKRVQAHKKLLEEEKAEKAKKIQEHRIKQMEERKKHLENYQESEWSSMAQLEEHLNNIEASLDKSFGGDNDVDEKDADEIVEDLYCIACEKDFRSLKAMQNHENSKKHKENVAFLKIVMEEEDAKLGSIETPNQQTDDEDSEPEVELSSEALLMELIKTSDKTRKKKKKHPKSDQANETEINGICENEEDLQNKSTHAYNSETNESCVKNENAKPEFTENEISDSKKSASKKPKKSKTANKGTSNQTHEATDQKVQPDDEKAEKPCTVCGTCNVNFSSRNKLFEHLKQSGHAVYRTEDPKASGSTKKRKKGKM